MEITTTGIVLYDNNYLNDSKLFYILTDKGIKKIYALGLQNIKSKNRISLKLLNEISISYFQARQLNKYNKLKTSSILKDNYFLILKSKKIHKFLLEIINLLINVNDYTNIKWNSIYSLFKEMLIYLEDDFIDKKIIFYFFYFKFLKKINYTFEIKRCKLCEQKLNIYTLSLKIGGLLCKKCSIQENLKQDKINYMELFISFYKIQKWYLLNCELYENSKFLLWLYKKIIDFHNINFNFYLNYVYEK